MGSRKKRSSRKRGNSYRAEATFEDAGIYLPAFMAGLITTLFTIILLASIFSTRESVKRVLDQVETDPTTLAVDELGSKEFDDVLKTGNESQLSNLLSKLNTGSQSAEVPARLSHNRRRVDVANQMLTMSLSEPQRELAIISKIDALAMIYGLDLINELQEPNVAATLGTTARSYLKDGNEKIARTARMAMLKHDAFELAKTGDRPELQPIADQIIELLRDFPDDELVFSTIKMIVAFYNRQNASSGSKNGLVLMQKIQAAAGVLKSPQAIELVQTFSDASKLQALDYEKSFENRWINGPVGEIKMIDSSLELLADRQAGKLILVNIDKVAHWFEQENQYVRSASIYQAMLDAADTYQSPDVATLARRMGKDGLRRASLVNQKLNFAGTSADLQPLDAKTFEGKSVVVVFWSRNNPDSVTALTQVHRDTLDWRRKGGIVLAVCIDAEPAKNLATLAEKMPGIGFVIGDDEQGVENLLLEQCPSFRTPRALLVNRNGIVVDVNVPIIEVKTEASYLMSR